MSSARPWVIYTLHDPRTPELVRYVGKTFDTKARMYGHLREAKRDQAHTYCNKWKRSLLRDGVEPVLTIIETGVGSTWVEAEIRWIAHYRTLVGDKLTNHTKGGEGFQGQHSSETKARMRLAHKGKKHTPEQIAKRVEARRNWRPSVESRERMRQAQTGKTQTPEQIAKKVASMKATLATPEQKAKRSQTSKEVGQRSEERAARSARMKGFKHSDEAKAKISQARRATLASKAASGV